MFEYFRTNYPWNLATSMAIELGGNMTEIDDVCRGLHDHAARGDQDAIDAFFSAWIEAGRRAEAAASLDEKAGNRRGAANKYKRAAIYYMTGERTQSHTRPERLDAYKRMLSCFSRFVELRGENCRRVMVPYKGGHLPALFVQGTGEGPRPCMIHFDGLDVMKELLYMTGIGTELAERGVSCLIVDHPGVGEALRLHGLKSFPQTEVPAAAAVDFLETQPDIDASRVGIMALSLGGYYAPRAAAYEPRLKCCVCWGGLYDFGARFALRLEGKGSERSVPQYFEHVQWVLGVGSLQEAVQVTSQMHLRDAAPLIRCPILITHGENDRQVPLEQARLTIEACVNAPVRELKVHKVAEGGAEHCSIDNFSITVDYMAHWISQHL